MDKTIILDDKSFLNPIDVAILQITPPDKNGFCSFGIAIDVAREAMKQASICVGEINTQIPRTFGDRERAQALIDIAHPGDRPYLVQKAKDSKILYDDQIFLLNSARLYPSHLSTTFLTKNNLKIRFRGIKPSDEEGMRHFFYRFSDTGIYYRYLHAIRSMPHPKMQEYVNIDWNQTISIVGLLGEEGQGRIIAEARYIRIPGKPYAEVVFIVDERYQRIGIASFLYKMFMQLATERGLKGFLAEVLFSNNAAMKVLQKGDRPVIPLVIIMFRKYDGGIRVCSRKTVLNRNVFLTTPIKRICTMVFMKYRYHFITIKND